MTKEHLQAIEELIQSEQDGDSYEVIGKYFVDAAPAIRQLLADNARMGKGLEFITDSDAYACGSLTDPKCQCAPCTAKAVLADLGPSPALTTEKKE